MVNANDSQRLIDNQDSSSSPTPAHFWASTLALCFCTLTHAYLLISVFPYSGYLAIYLLPNVANEDNAGSYAGLLASSFMLGRAISSYSWGKWADIYGRTTILCASLALSSLFSILFGMSQTFCGALLFRGFLGVSNGIIGTTKTLMSELAENNEELETRGMALVIGMRGWGFLVCPAIGGSLAEVVKQYPTASWVVRFEPFLSRFPFLLPNIVGAVFCITSLVMVKLFVNETLPGERLHPPTEIVRDCLLWCKRMLCIPRSSQQEEKELIKETSLIPNYSSNSLNDDGEEKNSNESHSLHTQQHKENNGNANFPVTMSTIWSRPDTRQHLILYWVYSFVIISVDEAFPLFCISKQAGLSLSEAAIGKILSISGLIFVICQYICYTQLVDWLGIYASITVSVIFTIPSIFLIPACLLFPSSSMEPLSLALLSFLSILMAIYRIFANIFFSSITIATNRTVPASLRAATNGFGSLGASIAKGVGPAMCGVFVAFNFSSGVVPPHMGATIVFGVLSLLALLVAVPASTRLEPQRHQHDDR
jgi:MFS family permease